MNKPEPRHTRARPTFSWVTLLAWRLSSLRVRCNESSFVIAFQGRGGGLKDTVDSSPPPVQRLAPPLLPLKACGCSSAQITRVGWIVGPTVCGAWPGSEGAGGLKIVRFFTGLLPQGH